MGQQQSQQVVYSVPVSPKEEGYTPIYRNPICKDSELLSSPDKNNLRNLQDAWLSSVQKYADNECLAQRQSDDTYKATTYKQVHKIAQEIGSGVINLNLASVQSEHLDYKLQMVGIYAKNRQQWQEVDIGCAYLYGMTIIPLYDTLGPENISYCLKNSQMSVVFASDASVDVLLKTQDLQNLKNIVAYDTITEEQKQKAKQRNLQLLSYEEVRIAGSKNVQQYKDLKPTDIYTFSYTSGTTGNPKGAMLTHGNFISMFSAIQNHPQAEMYETDVHLSYLPLPHVFDRAVCSVILHKGGSIYYYSGDPLKLKQDLADVRPTIFCSVPRLFNKFYDAINNGIQAAGGIKKFLGELAIKTKIDNYRSNGQLTHALWDSLVFKKVRENLFGGRVRWMLTGSAPLSKDVLDFFQIALSCPMFEAYGQTESLGASFLTQQGDIVSGHVGGVSVNQEFKLEDIPEMKYLSTDKNSEGQPLPRGEVLIRGPAVFAGYYKDLEKTKEAIDKDGWLHTGDVGSINTVDGSLKIVDRKKNIFKLAQGEYVAPEKVEACYLKSEGVAECFVHGDSLESYCIGVVVPDKEVVQKYAQELGIQENDLKSLCQNDQINKKLLQNMKDQANSQKLNSFEQVKKIYLEHESFQVLGCMTNTMKLQRYNAKVYFKDILDKMYKEGL